MRSIVYEPSGIETLDLQAGEIHGHNQKEYVRIAVLDDGMISLLIVHFDQHWRVDSMQALLSVSDIDAVIEALQEAKGRAMTHGGTRTHI